MLIAYVKDYVVERWDEVSASMEFEHCCKEVAAGEYVSACSLPSITQESARWGPDGGKTLMSVFRRLRSPAVLAP